MRRLAEKQEEMRLRNLDKSAEPKPPKLHPGDQDWVMRLHREAIAAKEAKAAERAKLNQQAFIVRWTKEEHDIIQQAARKEGRSLNSYVVFYALQIAKHQLDLT